MLLFVRNDVILIKVWCCCPSSLDVAVVAVVVVVVATSLDVVELRKPAFT